MVLKASLKQKTQVRRRKPALLKSWEALLRTVSKLPLSWQMSIPITVAIVGLWSYAAVAQTPPTVESVATATADLKVGLDTMWVMIAGFLVFFMNAGFCMLETGMCRQKNAVNVLAKNLIVFALSTVAFWAIGFGLMFSNGNGWIGASGGFFLTGADNSPVTGDAYQGIFKAISWAGVPLAAKFFFQLVFAGTAATIVSGAVAERIKFIDFLLFSLLLVGIAYPITGHWIWGGGWLSTLGFYDFAGSTVVHAVGGWAALMGASFLGARIGKYNPDGSANAIPPHNLSIATLGALILWLGWFGFNPGSTMSVGNGSLISHIALTTNTGGAFGAIAATVVAWAVLGKPDLTMTINGLLAGLVAVTASCAWISVPSAAIIGSVGGILVVFAVGFFDKLKIDDPVGAIAVHLVNGVWGTIALGLFSQSDAFGATPAPKVGLLFGGGIEQLWYQLVGTLTVGGFTVAISSIFWILLKSTLGIRVTAEEEFEGLDIAEHGMEAYAGFAKESAFSGSSSYPSSNSEPSKY
jgi:Amt family ammonium transporter